MATLHHTTKPNASLALRDEILTRDLLLLRLERAEVQRILARYGALVDRLERKLRQRFGWIAGRGYDASSFTAKSMERNLKVLRDEITLAQREIERELRAGLIELGRAEQRWLPGAINVALGPVATKVSAMQLSTFNIAAILDTKPMGGALFKEWSRVVGQNAFRRTVRSVREGMLNRESVDEIIRRTFGKAERVRVPVFDDAGKRIGFETKRMRRGGAFAATTREAETFVRTAYQATGNLARTEVMKANDRVLKAWGWGSFLDDRVCPECAARDGYIYSLEDDSPLDGGPAAEGGPGNLHPNDRCTRLPILKSWKEMGLNEPDLPPEMRQSMDGLVPAKETWRDWAARQPAGRLETTLGKTRAAAVARGDLDPRNLWDGDGALIKVKDLDIPKARDAA